MMFGSCGAAVDPVCEPDCDPDCDSDFVAARPANNSSDDSSKAVSLIMIDGSDVK